MLCQAKDLIGPTLRGWNYSDVADPKCSGYALPVKSGPLGATGLFLQDVIPSDARANQSLFSGKPC